MQQLQAYTVVSQVSAHGHLDINRNFGLHAWGLTQDINSTYLYRSYIDPLRCYTWAVTQVWALYSSSHHTSKLSFCCTNSTQFRHRACAVASTYMQYSLNQTPQLLFISLPEFVRRFLSVSFINTSSCQRGNP